MTAKAAFTDEEWVRVRRAPLVAALAISLADPGGPFETAKETRATIRSATNPPSREELVAEVALDVQAMTQRKQNPLSVSTREEATSFGAWLLAAAQAAAEAAKDGGFMGLGAEQVSQHEQTMLEHVRSAVGA